MAVTVEGFRDYLGPVPDSSESLELWLNAAKAKASAAGVPEFQNNALYDIFIYSLADMFYENRGMSFSGSYQATAEETARKLINSFVLSLRYTTEEGGASE